MKQIKHILLLIGITCSIAVAAQPPWNYNQSSVSHSIFVEPDSVIQEVGDLDDEYASINHYKSSATMTIPSIEEGDFLGVFYTLNNQEYCAGYIEWSISDTVLKVFGLDNYNDGYKQGESFKFKVWKQENNCFFDDVQVEFAPDISAPDSSMFLINGKSKINKITLQPNAIKYSVDNYCQQENAIAPISSISFNDLAYSSNQGIDMDENTGLIYTQSSNPGVYSIHFLTDICLLYDQFQIEILPSPDIQLEPNSQKCVNLYTITMPDEDLTYIWNSDTTRTGNTFKISSSKSVTVQAINEYGCSDYDSAYYEIKPLPSKIFDTEEYTPCNKPFVIRVEDSENEYVQYSWLEGSKADTFIVEEDADITLTVTNKYGCSTKETIRIRFKEQPNLNLGQDSIVCNPYHILKANKEFSSYKWSTGHTSNSIAIDESGSYWLKVRNEAGCVAFDTIDIELSHFTLDKYFLETKNATCNEIGKLIVDDSIGEGKENHVFRYTILNSNNNEVVVDLPDSSSSLFKEENDYLRTIELKEGKYEFHITDTLGCVQKFDEIFEIEKVCKEIDPIVTPNHDGDSDEFYIEFEGRVKIYDKYGRIKNQLEGPAYWDGTDSNGKSLPMGLYKIVDSKGNHTNITIIK